ncbi:SAM-dependent chlorinase/fluorinase [bacterium]|nr:SAM-dependent chlorinase/fluorinase [bacterium]
MPKPVITLTTDLGTDDHYVGVMKGIIWGINYDVHIVDLCHEINPFDIVEAAFKLECSYRYFPLQSVHVVVVDPGVGSPRRPILACGENHYFFAPDNGVLSWVMASDNVQRVYAIDATHYFLPKISNTFHGRDIFAPSAAHFLKIYDPTSFGDEITDYKRFKIPVAQVVNDRQIIGKIVSIDRFGNCITNIFEDDLNKMVEMFGKEKLVLTVNTTVIKGLSSYYAEKQTKEPLMIIGNAGYLEIAMNKAHASRELQLRKNLDITLSVL